MRTFILLLALAVGLAGCASDQMDKRLGFLAGQNIQFAVARLGDPDSKRTELGDTIYVWKSNQNVSLPTGAYGAYGSVGGAPPYGTAGGPHYVPNNRSCIIQLATGADGVIKSWQWSGNMGGCARYAHRLSLR